jgi:hypothetical protein
MNEYILNGENPRILFLTLTHGNEKEVAECLKRALSEDKYKNLNYLYVPEVSPSATKLGTRENAWGSDPNRSFNDPTNPEVIRLGKILEGCKFDICISFHEDPESDEFYLYDCFGENLEGSEKLNAMRKEILDLGVGLLDGVDDPSDPTLGDTFHQGYHYFSYSAEGEDEGFSADWMYEHGYTNRYINPEIPGKLPIETKTKMVEILLKYLVGKYIS